MYGKSKRKGLNVNDLIVQLNVVLEANWSKQQRAKGKWIEIDWKWMPVLKNTLSKYRAAGWKIDHQVELTSEGKILWLVFFDPSWKNEWVTPRDMSA